MVVVHSRALLMVGPHGSGKSTTAAAFTARDHTVIADDVTHLRRDAAGWVVELFLRRYIRDENGAAGAALFRYGFAFSIGLTLVPAGISALAWLARIFVALT